MKKCASSSQDPHPKIEITGAFDLFLNTDLWECVCLPVSTMVWKKVKWLAEPEISLRPQCSGCCVERDSAQHVMHFHTGSMFTFIQAENTHSLATSCFFFSEQIKTLNRCNLETKEIVNDYQWFAKMIITGNSVLIYPIDQLVTTVQTNVCGRTLKAIESDATWCLILVAG